MAPQWKGIAIVRTKDGMKEKICCIACDNNCTVLIKLDEDYPGCQFSNKQAQMIVELITEVNMPSVIQCKKCKRFYRFGDWVTPDNGTKVALDYKINSGELDVKEVECPACREKVRKVFKTAYCFGA